MKKSIRLVSLLVLLCISASGFAILLWFIKLQLRANGCTLITSFLILNCISMAFTAVACLPVLKNRYLFAAGAAAGIILSMALVGAKMALAHPGQQYSSGVLYCENGICPSTPPVLSTIMAEDETARAGASLAFSQEILDPLEWEVSTFVFDRIYEDLRNDARTLAVPNTLAIHSVPGLARYLLWLPPGKKKVPAIVFLHGYGGLSSGYLKPFLDRFGNRYALIAPILDVTGRFSNGDGSILIREIVFNHLPPEVDKDSLFLAGLSNGATSIVDLMDDAELISRFRGLILISGIKRPGSNLTVSSPLLVISGRNDHRFPPSYCLEAVTAFRKAGVSVTHREFDADHFLLLSANREVPRAIDDWISRMYDESR